MSIEITENNRLRKNAYAMVIWMVCGFVRIIPEGDEFE